MPEITGSTLLGTMMLMMGDIFTLLAVASASLACFTAILGRLSPKRKRRKEELRYGLGTVLLHIALIAMYFGKMHAPDMAGFPNGAFLRLSDLTTVMLLGVSMFILVVTAVVSLSGHSKA